MNSIRAAQEADDELVVQLLMRTFSNVYAAKGLHMSPERRAYLNDQIGRRAFASTFIYEADGEAVGTVTLVPPSSQCEDWVDGAFEIRLLAVDPRMQRRGIARALLQDVEQRAKAAGARAICLHARRGVPAQAQFYLTRGYLRDAVGDIDLTPYQEGYRKVLHR